MPGPPYTQQRRHPRLAEVIPAYFRLFGRRQLLPGRIVSLSAGGAAVLTPVPVPVHSTLEVLRFALPPIRQQRGAIIAVSAIVRWTGEHEVEPGDRRLVIGLQFLDLEEKAFTRVRNYVYYRLLDGPPEPPARLRRPPGFASSPSPPLSP